MRDWPDSEQLEWDRSNDNFEVLRRADLMISDFSGVIFDFALVFDKPVIYADTSFDPAPYDACWLDEGLWTFSILPQLGEQLTEAGMGDLKALVERCLHDPRYQQGRDAARAQTWAYPGEAAGRVADYLIAERQALLASREGAEQEGSGT